MGGGNNMRLEDMHVEGQKLTTNPWTEVNFSVYFFFLIAAGGIIVSGEF